MKRYLYLIISFLIGTVLLVLLMPRQNKLTYEYKEGKPWNYAPLIATFDFPIYKSESDLQAEKDSALLQFQPFFNANEQTEDEMREAFLSDVRSGIYKAVPTAYVNYVVGMLGKVYAAGVISPEDMSTLLRDRTKAVQIIHNQEGTLQNVSDLYSTRSAYEFIMSGDSLNMSHEVLARLNINKYLTPNLVLDKNKTTTAREDILNSVLSNSGMVVSGQRIIDRGDLVTAAQKQILDSFVKESEMHEQDRGEFWRRISGQTVFVVLILFTFFLYLRTYRRNYIDQPHAIMMFFFFIIIFPLVTYIMVRRNTFSIYLIPFSMMPLFMRIFFESRTAMMSMLVMLLLTSIGLRSPYEFLVLETFMGLVTIYAAQELSERAQVIRIAFIATVAGLLLQLAFDLSQGTDFAALDRTRYAYILVSGVLLLFAYPIMYLVEWLFGFTSSVTLVELSNLNNPLMRKLSKVAQGTFNHSIQVGNLAAEVADAIDAKPQLVRAAALYHDIGKMLNPTFFTENQSGVNPHDELQEKDGVSPEEQSAQIIINHVKDGIKLAEKYHLPRVLREFIVTHHGRSKTKYFYIQWKNNHPGAEVDEEHFTYPGPNPQTKEQAIIMMCDAVEASSRSLKEYTEESISELVSRIVDTQVQEGYFQNCAITYKDIQDAKKVLVDSLKTIYHTRIAYPELNKPEEPSVHPSRTHLFSGGFYRKR